VSVLWSHWNRLRPKVRLSPHMLNIRSTAAWWRWLRLTAVALGLFAGSGCTHEPESRISDHYWEYYQDGVYYVTSTLKMQDEIRKGEPLPQAIKIYAVSGEPVLIEDDGMGLGIVLQSEYERRHPRRGR
jgi:hypothetical protein